MVSLRVFLFFSPVDCRGAGVPAPPAWRPALERWNKATIPRRIEIGLSFFAEKIIFDGARGSNQVSDGKSEVSTVTLLKS